ncbi:UDP-glucosyltransferase 2-like [Schistocerca americana]|uniref:UDP-glucosyltransferase 2-like n=1 Tax=Schistocerca americana TaxID=7009 RepID=UPI001F4FD593|nr:UDP-glucosyltransferase 2-like [Schistocerca americana]
MKVLLVAVAAAVALSALGPACEAADILAAFPFPSKSHWHVFRQLLHALAARGHRLTVIAYFPEENPPPGWEHISLEASQGAAPQAPNFFEVGDAGAVIEALMVSGVGKRLCAAMMETEGVKQLVTSGDRKFDLLLIEVFSNDCYLAFAHKYRVPVVGAVALGGGLSWMTDMVGNPFPHAYLPEPMLPLSTGMSFLQRMHNSLFGNFLRFYRQFYYLPSLDSMVRQHFSDPDMPSLANLERNTSLLLVNTHVSFYYPRPLVPNIIEVGGMHIKPPKKLPQDLQKFMDDAKDGVIFFSLGSNIKSSDIPEKQKAAILSVFSKLKQKVLWKFDLESMPNQPANLKLSKWFPQNDLLNHKNMKLFITHGGLMSIQEAISAGVPLLGIPVFGDQNANLARAEADGFGMKLRVNELTEESFGRALNELLTNPKYKQNAEKRSVLFHDRPEKPMETAVHWTEYVIRHKGAYHMRSASLDLAWYQYLLLDVIAALVLLLGALLLLVALSVRALYRAARAALGSPPDGKNRPKRD